MIDRAAPRLVFPGRMVEDERTAASFDIDSGYLTVTVAKQVREQRRIVWLTAVEIVLSLVEMPIQQVKGEHFADLDLLTLLKRKPAQQCSAALVEEVPAQTSVYYVSSVEQREGD